MGEITGETSLGYARSVYMHRLSKTWKMSGDAKIATLIPLLNKNNENIENKIANTKEPILSIEEDKSNLIKNLKLYPNPTAGMFNLNFGLEENSAVSFRIFNLTGRVVYEEKERLFNKGNNKYTFKNEVNLSAGVYMFNVTSQEFSKTLKLVVD